MTWRNTVTLPHKRRKDKCISTELLFACAHASKSCSLNASVISSNTYTAFSSENRLHLMRLSLNNLRRIFFSYGAAPIVPLRSTKYAAKTLADFSAGTVPLRKKQKIEPKYWTLFDHYWCI